MISKIANIENKENIEIYNLESDANDHIIEELQTYDGFNNKQKSNFNDISDSSNMSVQVKNKNNSILTDRKIISTGKNQGCDKLVSSYEAIIKFESIENIYKTLKIKYEFIADQVQFCPDQKESNNDYNITKINSDLKKAKHDMDKLSNRVNAMYKREMFKISKDLKIFKMLLDKTTKIDNYIDQIIFEINSFKNIVEDIHINKENMSQIIELLKNFNEQHCIQVCKQQHNFMEQTRTLENEINKLKTYVIIKDNEIDALVELINNQSQSIDYYEKRMNRFNEVFKYY